MSIFANGVDQNFIYANGVSMVDVYANGIKVFHLITGWTAGTYCARPGTSVTYPCIRAGGTSNRYLYMQLIDTSGPNYEGAGLIITNKGAMNTATSIAGTSTFAFILKSLSSGGYQIGMRSFSTDYLSPVLNFDWLNGFDNAVRSSPTVLSATISIIGDGGYRFKIRYTNAVGTQDSAWINLV